MSEQRNLRSSCSQSDLLEMGKGGNGNITRTAFDNLKAGKKKIVKELETKIAESTETIKNLEKELTDAKEQLEVQKTESNRVINELQKTIDDFQVKYNELQESINDFELKYNEKDKETRKIQKNFENFKNNTYQTLQDTCDEQQTTILTLQSNLRNAIDKQKSLKNELTIMQSKVEDLHQTKVFADRKIRALIRELNATKDSFIQSTLRKDGIALPEREHVSYHDSTKEYHYSQKPSYSKPQSYRMSPYERR